MPCALAYYKKSLTTDWNICMAQYAIVYLGGNPPSTPEAGQQHMKKYMAWLADLGAAAVSPGNPFKGTHTVHPDSSISSGSNTAMSGYTIIEAVSIDAALVVAKACPFLEVGGTLEVSEVMKMPG